LFDYDSNNNIVSHLKARGTSDVVRSGDKIDVKMLSLFESLGMNSSFVDMSEFEKDPMVMVTLDN
jgi:hypothetical protein